MTVEVGLDLALPTKQDTSRDQKKSPGKTMDTIMPSLARKRNTSTLFGSKRWWQPSCWVSRGQQEAYLRKLYSRRYSNGVVNPAVCTSDEQQAASGGADSSSSSPWQPQAYELPTADHHYLEEFLRGRAESECPALSTPRASPTEKCVEFLCRNEARSRECVVIDVPFDQELCKEQREALMATERSLDEILRTGSTDGAE